MNRIPVGILGATGIVGQKFVELLANHPWFEVVALAASEKSQGKPYGEIARWRISSPLNPALARIIVSECKPPLPCKVVFSALDSEVAKEIETLFAEAGYAVISNSSPHRMVPNIPLLIPEVNSDHLNLVHSQRFSPGMIVTNPNCSVIGITTALKPLADRWGIDQMQVTTLQAISGAGYPGVSSFDILDNVIPYIAGEEAKIETEPLKILGTYADEEIRPYSMKISAQCNRVPVMDGHMACVSVKLRRSASQEDILDAWQSFSAEPQKLDLPLAPKKPIAYFPDERHPQPKLHRYADKGMAISIGRLRKCPIFDWKFVLLSHNTIRGAAGGAILNGELMAVKSMLYPNNLKNRF